MIRTYSFTRWVISLPKRIKKSVRARRDAKRADKQAGAKIDRLLSPEKIVTVDEAHREKTYRQQERLICITFLAFIAAGAYAFIALWQVNISREYNEKQLRAYVLSTGRPQVILNTDQTVSVSIQVKNFGATTANRITYARIAFTDPQGKKPDDQFRGPIWGETSADNFNLGAQQTGCITWKGLHPDESRLKGRPRPLLFVGVELQYQDVYSGCKFNAVGYTTKESIPDITPNVPLDLDYAFGWDDNNASTSCRRWWNYRKEKPDQYGPRGNIPQSLRAPEKETIYPDPLDATVQIGECPWSQLPK